MPKGYILSSIVVSLIIYGWEIFAYMADPIHQSFAKTFSNEMEVVEAIQHNADGAGVYYFPDCTKNDAQMMKNPPLITINYLPNAQAFMGYQPFLAGYFIDLFIAAFLSLITLFAKPMRYFGRVFYLTFVGFIGIFTIYMYMLNWYGYDYLSAIYNLVMWTLAIALSSLAIAAIMKNKESENV
jgi:hypothetical protein